jgi:hypothetical protein
VNTHILHQCLSKRQERHTPDDPHRSSDVRHRSTPHKLLKNILYSTQETKRCRLNQVLIRIRQETKNNLN